MCFFSSPKVPDAVAPPALPPSPTILPSEVSAQSAEDTRTKKLQQLQYGLASTIKTSPRGIVGQGAELQPNSTGKQTLGGA